MNAPLTGPQAERAAQFREFAAAAVTPFAAAWDREQRIPESALGRLASAGYLGAMLPASWGGQGWDAVTFGLLNEALGRADPALTGVVTVQTMVAAVLAKWGSDAQRSRWLPALARGDAIGAFALTEPGGGSDLPSLAARLRSGPGGDGLILSGEKQ